MCSLGWWQKELSKNDLFRQFFAEYLSVWLNAKGELLKNNTLIENVLTRSKRVNDFTFLLRDMLATVLEPQCLNIQGSNNANGASEVSKSNNTTHRFRTKTRHVAPAAALQRLRAQLSWKYRWQKGWHTDERSAKETGEAWWKQGKQSLHRKLTIISLLSLTGVVNDITSLKRTLCCRGIARKTRPWTLNYFVSTIKVILYCYMSFMKGRSLVCNWVCWLLNSKMVALWIYRVIYCSCKYTSKSSYQVKSVLYWRESSNWVHTLHNAVELR